MIALVIGFPGLVSTGSGGPAAADPSRTLQELRMESESSQDEGAMQSLEDALRAAPSR
jgi:hypothetical protein